MPDEQNIELLYELLQEIQKCNFGGENISGFYVSQ